MWVLLGIFASCNGGPKTTWCVVDPPHSNFQCSDSNHQFSQSKKDTDHWVCASPSQVEDFIKSCKKGVPALEDPCIYLAASDVFSCKVSGEIHFLEANNFACITSQDLKRIEQRCE